jgi:hypothetical protein
VRSVLHGRDRRVVDGHTEPGISRSAHDMSSDPCDHQGVGHDRGRAVPTQVHQGGEGIVQGTPGPGPARVAECSAATAWRAARRPDRHPAATGSGPARALTRPSLQQGFWRSDAGLSAVLVRRGCEELGSQQGCPCARPSARLGPRPVVRAGFGTSPRPGAALPCVTGRSAMGGRPGRPGDDPEMAPAPPSACDAPCRG